MALLVLRVRTELVLIPTCNQLDAVGIVCKTENRVPILVAPLSYKGDPDECVSVACVRIVTSVFLLP